MFDREFPMMRPAPFMGHPDYRIHEMNRRLQQRMEDSDNLWWDAFATEFFEDDAILTLSFTMEDGPKRYSNNKLTTVVDEDYDFGYLINAAAGSKKLWGFATLTIGRSLIPRYFRSMFEGGVTDLYYVLKYCKESFQNTSIILDCEHALIITYHGKTVFTKVVTDGRLLLEFTFDDLMRIRSWHFMTRQHHELVPRSVLSMQDPVMAEQLSQNVTCQGLTSNTLNFLKLCVILEPMQELMCRHKVYGLSPRDCLKTTLFQKWQRIVAPPETSRPAAKRRKKKAQGGANSSVRSSTPPGGRPKKSPGPPIFTNIVQDVMLVGEPTLMGGELGDEDERLISRLENTQYKPVDMDESSEYNIKPIPGQNQQMYPTMPMMASPMGQYPKNTSQASTGGIRTDGNLPTTNG